MAATMTLTVAEYLCLTTGTTSGAGSAYPSKFLPGFQLGSCSSILSVHFVDNMDIALSVFRFTALTTPLWYLQTCLTVILMNYVYLFPSGVSVQPIECSKCICTNSSTVMSQKELQDRLNNLHSILSSDHRNKSSFLRTKFSATDNRPSSVSIGITLVILLVSVMLFIILLDILPRN
jgi:hypothetical protein